MLIKDILKELRPTLVPKQLALALGLKPKYIRNWLNNSRVIPEKHLETIRRVLHLNEEEFAAFQRIWQLSKVSVKDAKTQQHREVDSFLQDPHTAHASGHVAPPHRDVRASAQHSPEAVSDMIMQLLSSAIDRPPDPDQPIFLTFQGNQSVLPVGSVAYKHWSNLIISLLKKGWRIEHVLRLNRDTMRSLGLVRQLMPFMSAGAYTPHVIRASGTLSPAHDVVVVPGIGTLFGLETTGSDGLDRGIVATDEDSIRIFTAFCRNMIRNSTPLLTRFGPLDPVYNHSLIEAETRSTSSKRLLVKAIPSIVLDPPEWYEHVPFWAWTDGEAYHDTLRSHGQRIAYIRQHPQLIHYRDIYSRRAITNLVLHGQYPNPFKQDQMKVVPRQSIKRHLENIIQVLIDCPNYEIALITQDEEERVPMQHNWQVTSDNTVLLELFDSALPLPGHIGNIQIRDAAISQAFSEFFQECWENINEMHRDRQETIKWFQEQIVYLNDHSKQPQ